MVSCLDCPILLGHDFPLLQQIVDAAQDKLTHATEGHQVAVNFADLSFGEGELAYSFVNCGEIPY